MESYTLNENFGEVKKKVCICATESLSPCPIHKTKNLPISIESDENPNNLVNTSSTELKKINDDLKISSPVISNDGQQSAEIDISNKFQNLNMESGSSEIALSLDNNSLSDSPTTSVASSTASSRTFLDPYSLSIRHSVNSMTYRDPMKSSSRRTVDYDVWLQTKERKKLFEIKKKREMAKMKEDDRKRKEEMEKSNFTQWLSNKKKQAIEVKRKSEESLLLAEEKRKEEVAKKSELNKQNYELWLKRKEEMHLVKKLTEQKIKVEKATIQRRRQEINSGAFEEWLKKSKTKAKPLPLNRGLDSLRAAPCVSYVNPKPWIPNIETNNENELLD